MLYPLLGCTPLGTLGHSLLPHSRGHSLLPHSLPPRSLLLRATGPKATTPRGHIAPQSEW